MPRIVYEATNDTLKECFIGSSAFPLEGVQAAHQTIRPAPISHWRFTGEKISYREIERGLADSDLRPFIEGYARSVEKAGWKTILE